jgi:hypothetical protein
MKTATKKRATKRRAKKPAEPHVYREPKTAAELGITCALCGGPAQWFDHGRGRKDHRAGFVCSAEPPIGQREKLLVREQPSAP